MRKRAVHILTLRVCIRRTVIPIGGGSVLGATRILFGSHVHARSTQIGVQITVRRAGLQTRQLFYLCVLTHGGLSRRVGASVLRSQVCASRCLSVRGTQLGACRLSV